MSIILTSKKLTKAFDSRPLFENLNFAIESGEHIGLIGPNGAGKSTLLKILSGLISADDGEVILQKGIRVAHLEQNPEFAENADVRAALLANAPPHKEDWELDVKADELLWKLDLDSAGITSETKVKSLSGGWKKRLAFARELMHDPDLLLMDEPTNHLDIEGILWLEKLIASSEFATLTVTHDRLFLQRMSNRILELDRRNAGGILSVKGDYSKYLELKDSLMSSQENRETILRGNLRRETEWLKQGAKARTTKQQARIGRHAELSDEVSELATRNVKRVARLEFQESDNNPKRLIEAKKVSKSYSEGTFLFSNFNFILGPGKRLGILGANGCGKSTLIRVLLGLEDPSSGHIYRSDQLKVAYFEQNRDQLDPKVTLLRTLCPMGDHVTYAGKQVHIRSYLDRFLFTKDEMDMPVGRLSGGERSRVLIARLMLIEANLLVLDEPTNDLDIATLNVLQDCLVNFEGSIILVSHDRYFLDQVATEILAFPKSEKERKAGTLHFFSDLAQWESWHDRTEISLPPVQNTAKAQSIQSPSSGPGTSKKELDRISKKIENLESKYQKLEAECSLPENVQDHEKLIRLGNEMKSIQAEIDSLYGAWESLEA